MNFPRVFTKNTFRFALLTPFSWAKIDQSGYVKGGTSMKRLLGAVFCACTALAQVNTARIDGTVTDPTGAAVPAAEVIVSNPATASK